MFDYVFAYQQVQRTWTVNTHTVPYTVPYTHISRGISCHVIAVYVMNTVYAYHIYANISHIYTYIYIAEQRPILVHPLYALVVFYMFTFYLYAYVLYVYVGPTEVVLCLRLICWSYLTFNTQILNISCIQIYNSCIFVSQGYLPEI